MDLSGLLAGLPPARPTSAKRRPHDRGEDEDPGRADEQPGTSGDVRRGDAQEDARPAGWGTDHVGQGRYKLHGGASLWGTASPSLRWRDGEASYQASFERLVRDLQAE
jgi:hypothetical protein